MEQFLPDRLDRVSGFLQQLVDRDQVPAIGACVGSSRGVARSWLLGKQRWNPEPAPIRSDALFLIASPTKPIVAMAAMMLVEEGKLQLADPIASFVPDFGTHGKRAITLAHVLTHTSGLPDMLPENGQLRAEQAPLAEFVRRTCGLRISFPPGHDVQYQSMGILMLGEVIRMISGWPLPEFLKQRIFDPLAMHATSLGRRTELERVVQNRAADAQMSGAEHWNSPYWLGLGAPWGGLLSTPDDLAKLSRHLLQIHTGTPGIISRATLSAMSANQLQFMPEVPEKHRRCQPWGYGWQLNWPAHVASFGDLLSADAFGHWGATGTMVWIDPARDAFAIALSTQPLELGRRWQTRFSNLVCAALG